MQTYYFTFGAKHRIRLGGKDFNSNGYVAIEAKTLSDARSFMFLIFQDKWAFSYDEETFKPELFFLGETARFIYPYNQLAS